MILLGVFFALSIVFSFLCSVWEAVLLSITPSYVNSELEKGSSIGKTLQKFKDDIDRPLSGILTLNTIAHTVGAIGVGAQAGKVFGDQGAFKLFGLMEISWESIVAVVMTLAILVLSEIIPKTWGANNWKSLAPFTVRSLSILLTLLAPIIWMTSLITKKMKKEKGKSVLSRADFLALANVGRSSGAIAEEESTIINNLLGMDTLKVSDVMTPRAVMHTIDDTTTLSEYYKTISKMPFSRIPLYSERQDNITGLALKDNILQEMVEGNGEKKMSDIMLPVKMINQDKVLRELFTHFTKENDHLAVVVDNYGSVTGIVTMEDMFETMLGMEIVDESDGVTDMQALARKRWNERAKKVGLIE